MDTQTIIREVWDQKLEIKLERFGDRKWVIALTTSE